MKAIKILSVLLCVVMLVAVFASCEKELTIAEIEAKAAANLLNKPYLMKMTIDYSCDDKTMNDYFEKMSGMTTNVYVDGENLEMSMDLMGMKMEYVIVNRVLYIELAGQKIKCKLSEEEYKDFIEENAGSSATDLAAIDFATSEMTTDEDGNITISCKGFNEEGNALVDSLLSSMGDSTTADVDLDTENFAYTVIVDSEYNFKKMEMKMALIMDIDGYGEVTVEIDYDFEFDYSKGKAITKPSDSEDYITMDSEDVLG